MKQNYFIKIRLFLLTLLFVGIGSLSAQIGINTTTPNGALDISSSNSGVVFPRVALAATDQASPVLNPAGGTLIAGTTVFNTNETFTGTNDVYIGKYYWNGSEWIAQFEKKQIEKFEQSTLDFRTYSNGNSVVYQNIPGLTGQTFTAKFTGTYRIDVQANYGAGYMNSPTSGRINVGTTEGYFDFTFNGTNNYIYAHSYSAYNRANSGSTINYYGIWAQSSFKLYVDLVAGQSYNLNLSFDQFFAQHFVGSGDSGTGRGHVGYDIPCYVEFEFID